MSERECKLIVAFGKKGVGKSFTTRRMIADYVTGNPATGRKPRRALILDVNDEFEDIKPLAPKDVLRFSAHPIIEARRIRPFRPDGKKMSLDEIATLLGFVLENYYGGLLLIEDINRYTSDAMPQDLIGAICTNRHTAVDIVIHYQSIGRLTPKIWQNANIIRFHKNLDSVDKHESKIQEKYELFKIVEELVNHQYEIGNKRYYCFVDLDEMKITSKVPDAVFEHAVNEYVRKCYRQTVGAMLKEVDLNGRKAFTNKNAHMVFVKRMRQKYLPK